MHLPQSYTVIVPAAGVGKRMQADRPKQYLDIFGKTLLEHTISVLLSHPRINKVILALDPHDPYFDTLPLSDDGRVQRVEGGKQRADSVLAGLQALTDEAWVMVHDAARPCLSHEDIDVLLAATEQGGGAILATPVKDTMKRAVAGSGKAPCIAHTEPRENLWHALTPQCFPSVELKQALSGALKAGVDVTDEASAIEWAGGQVRLVEGKATNIKVTRPEDLPLAEFYLQHRSM